jgi:hypothetical protein
VLSGKWNIDNTPTPNGTRSAMCNRSSYSVNISAVGWNCSGGSMALCARLVPADPCYCTTYGSNDECFVNYAMKSFSTGFDAIEGVAGSGQYLMGNSKFWQQFEFTLTMTVINRAMLATTNVL